MNMTISDDRFGEMFEDICENYCIWTVQASSQESLNQHCRECPMNNIHIDEYWEERHKEDEEPEWERDDDD